MDDKNKEENKIKELEERIAELENNWKRALADYKNLERRTAEDRETFFNFSNETLIRCLFPLLDNLETLTKHVHDKGLQMIVKDFQQLLKSEGIEEVNTENKDFDPETMEAIDTVEGKNNKVVEVITKGYFLKNKLLRPARVKVGKEN
jgi:molecular chaperone GrpE